MSRRWAVAGIVEAPPTRSPGSAPPTRPAAGSSPGHLVRARLPAPTAWCFTPSHRPTATDHRDRLAMATGRGDEETQGQM
jgi:hypothetical protein